MGLTSIEQVNRKDGNPLLQGFEMGRTFSWAIDEETGKQVEQQSQQVRKPTEEQMENSKKAFSVCLEAKKYLVKFRAGPGNRASGITPKKTEFFS